jgi:predicted GNAT family acetyltransferase
MVDESGKDANVDEAEEESFPASDPPANTPETGIRVGRGPVVTDNSAEHQFEIALEGEKAVLIYERTPTSMRLLHTEVPPAFRGQHYGDVIIRAALDAAHAEQLQVVAICPFVRAYLKRHPDALKSRAT